MAVHKHATWLKFWTAVNEGIIIKKLYVIALQMAKLQLLEV